MAISLAKAIMSGEDARGRKDRMDVRVGANAADAEKQGRMNVSLSYNLAVAT